MSIALDDFGAGLSSFQHLKALPADMLKIDGRFIRDLGVSAIDSGVVAAAQTIGRSMGIETVAEFAHSPAIVERLRTLGVDRAQGYAFGEPQPLDAITTCGAAGVCGP
jgi:EAL domain-containing protein (putative c-di-GMP-specific phosphodiesterase class I)